MKRIIITIHTLACAHGAIAQNKAVKEGATASKAAASDPKAKNHQ
ncbi:MAG: hypothetical protein ACI91J_002510 [Yoonia sp.]|jgi:hypothetical protein